MSETANPPDGANLPEFSVSEICRAKAHGRGQLPFVRVRGEISGLKFASSGHVYFDLKDDKAVINAIIWRGVAGKLRQKPKAGIEVVVTGRVTTYPGSSRYQIIVERLELAGLGALMALLEQRKKKLAAEGLFDAARKKTAALFARGDWRHFIAHRGGNPRHHAPPDRAVSPPRHPVAGGGAG